MIWDWLVFNFYVDWDIETIGGITGFYCISGIKLMRILNVTQYDISLSSTSWWFMITNFDLKKNIPVLLLVFSSDPMRAFTLFLQNLSSTSLSSWSVVVLRSIVRLFKKMCAGVYCRSRMNIFKRFAINVDPYICSVKTFLSFQICSPIWPACGAQRMRVQILTSAIPIIVQYKIKLSITEV